MSGGRTALVIGAVGTLSAAAIDVLLRGRWLGLALAMVAVLLLALFIVGLPTLVLRAVSALRDRVREQHWDDRQGSHHSIAGISLHIEHDARHSWIDGPGLQRALGTRDSDEVLAARLAGRWRRNGRGQLLLRVDAVIEYLARRPDRLEPRTLRLRHYLEREVLYPQAQRMARR